MAGAITRWQPGGLVRSYRWQYVPAYWRGRRRLQGFRFEVARRLFAFRLAWRETTESAGIVPQLLGLVWKQAVLAGTVVIIVEAGERLFMAHAAPLQERLPFLFVVDVNQAIYTNFLGVLLQVAGVFLGLYFAAISLVAGNAYARVPNDVRALVLEDIVGTAYLRVVAFAATAVTYLLVLASLGWKLGALSVYLTAVVTALSILSFVALGIRAFRFFDPTLLANRLNLELARWVLDAGPGGFRWLDASFQNSYRSQAERMMTTYRNLTRLAGREEHLHGAGLADIARGVLSFLQWYATRRPYMPSESLWFRRVPEHTDWFRAPHSAVNIALKTGTPLQPAALADLSWLERELSNLVREAVLDLSARGEQKNVMTVLDAIPQTARSMSEEHAPDEALSLIRAFVPVVERQAEATTASGEFSGSVDEDQLLLSIHCIDTLGYALVEAILGFVKALDDLGADSIREALATTRWHKPESVYRLHLPRAALQRVEYLRRRLAFEQAAEHRLTTPNWYLSHEVALATARFLSDCVATLVGEIEKFFVVEAEGWALENRYVAAAQLVERGLEACEKAAAVLLPETRTTFEGLASLNTIADTRWPTPDWAALAETVKNTRTRLLLILAQSASSLDAVPRRGALPDYFGQAYFILTQATYDALADGDVEQARQLFPRFFFFALAAADRLRRDPGQTANRYGLILSTEPVRDLLDVSGYGRLYQEVHRLDLWTPVKQQWDRYFEKAEDKPAKLGFLAAMLAFRHVVFGISTGDLLRTTRQQDFARRLRDLGWETDDDYFPLTRARRSNGDVPLLIRALGISPMMFYGADDVFVSQYLMPLSEDLGMDIDWPRKASEFAESLRRRETRETNGEDEKDAPEAY
jgi:hypothetical protein